MFCRKLQKIGIKKSSSKNFVSINKQKGSSLLFTILIMSFVMGISFGVSYILFQEIKINRDIGDSVVAFYAAESGTEKLMMYQNSLNSKTQFSDIIYPGISYIAQVYNPGDTENGCPSDTVHYCLQSTGIYGNTKRAIQVQY